MPRASAISAMSGHVLDGNVFVAHNAAFDWRFVSSEVARATGRRLEGRRLCTVRLARRAAAAAAAPPARQSWRTTTAWRSATGTGRSAMRSPPRTILLRLLAEARRSRLHPRGAICRRLASRRLRGRRKRRPSALPGAGGQRTRLHERTRAASNEQAARRLDACMPSRRAARSSTAARCSASSPSRSGSAAFRPTNGTVFRWGCAACSSSTTRAWCSIDTGAGNKETEKFYDIYGIENAGGDGAARRSRQAIRAAGHSARGRSAGHQHAPALRPRRREYAMRDAGRAGCASAFRTRATWCSAASTTLPRTPTSARRPATSRTTTCPFTRLVATI